MNATLKNILAAMGIPADSIKETVPFKNEEDGEEYKVWKISLAYRTLVLKAAKPGEAEIYKSYLSGGTFSVPELIGSTRYDGTDYLLMEYIDGSALTKCAKSDLTYALDALIALQARFWQAPEVCGTYHSFEKSLDGRISRGKYLFDEELEKAYSLYLDAFTSLPRTLCHDDLLPFNVIRDGTRAVLIDWEVGGILPYLTPLARLLAHSEESENAFFYMKDADKAYAIDYFYDHLPMRHGISYEDYRRSLDLFIFYELCEWVMLGNKYGNTDGERFRSYFKKAKRLAEAINAYQ